VIPFVKSPHFDEGSSPKKRRLLHHHHGTQQQPAKVEWSGQTPPDAAPFGVNEVAVPVNYVGVTPFKKCHGLRKRTRQQNVICVQISKDFASRLRKSLVQAACRTIVWFEDYLRDPRPILLDDLATAVSRTRVNHDVFEINRFLLQDGPDRPL
jgi:hypothetical protein